MKYVQAKYQQSIQFDFMLCGSEGEYSKSLVIKEGFKSTEYIEYKQPDTSKMNYGQIANVIGLKHEFMYKTAIATYPTFNILLSSGSSDFIPTSFFDNLLKINSTTPLCLGITPYHKQGFVYILNFAEKGEEKGKEYDIYKIDSSKSKEYSPMLAGIIGFTRSAIRIMNNKIMLPGGNEQTLLKTCMKHNIQLMPLANYWINIKIKNCDLTKLDSIIKHFSLTKQIKVENHVLEHIKLLDSFHI
jgi:hypothetical protein